MKGSPARATLRTSSSEKRLEALVVLVGFALTACKSGARVDPPEASESPQAKAVPAPLSSGPARAGASPTAADAGPPPLPFRTDREVAVDGWAKDVVSGLSLQIAFRHSDVGSPPRTPELNATGLEAHRKRGEARVNVELSANRLRLIVASRPFVLPIGAELRARSDRYGHLLFLPDGPGYRVASPGALRALLGERRLDVAPLGQAEVIPRGDGLRRHGFRTRRIEIVSRAGTGSFELARIPETGEGGVLLCRALLELLDVTPEGPPCSTDEVPLWAELRWNPSPAGAPFRSGAVALDAVTLNRRTDLPAIGLATPPPGASLLPPSLRSIPTDLFLGPPELSALRTGPGEVSADAGTNVPQDALVLVNDTEMLQFAWLDAAPLAWVGPRERLFVQGLQRGRYALEWRTFLADVFRPAETIDVPGTSSLSTQVRR